MQSYSAEPAKVQEIYNNPISSTILETPISNNIEPTKLPAEWSNLAKIVYKRTYSRRINETDTENWKQTVYRVIEGNVEKYRGTNLLEANEEERLFYYLYNRKATPAGRGLWFSGTQAQKNLGGLGLTNCSFLTLDDYSKFVIGMDYLMLGAGVGASVEHKYISKLPKVKKDVKIQHHNTRDADFIVPDSREGWCQLLRKILKAYFETGESFTYSTTCLRGAGENIETFGGKASGPLPLIAFVDKLCKLLDTRSGKHIRPVDALDIICSIGECIVSGNVRRSAIIVQGDCWDKEFLKAKRWDLGNIPTQRAMANLSVVCDDIDDVHPLFWETYKNGEPFGIINLKVTNKNGRMGEPVNDVAKGFNPCLTGETIVAVADGTGDKTIKALAEAGKDVAVYCLDEKGKLSIRKMRNPRITGHSQPIYKLTLDDGSTLRATPNHKFRLYDGQYKRLHELMPGDSLKILTKYEASIKDIFPKSNSNSQDYVWVNNGFKGSKSEHRLIYEFFAGPIPKGNVIHHKDYNAKNNRMDNLQMMTKEAHDDLHRQGMLGDKNPMRRAKTEWSEEKWDSYRQKHSDNNKGQKNKNYSGIDNAELKNIGIELTKSLGRRFSTEEWESYAKENNLPFGFSEYRKSVLGTLKNFAILCAIEVGIEITDLDPRTVRHYQALLSSGYDCSIRNREIFITKSCERCEKLFEVHHDRREIGFCSPCGTLRKIESNKNPEHIANRRTGMLASLVTRHNLVKESQTKIYSDLKFNLGRNPSKTEWVKACKDNAISFEISRASSPFKSYAELKESASVYNHKVVSVEFDGYEDVYNGTVDNFHNFFAGGFEAKTSSNKRKLFYLNHLQCGEIPLDDFEICNLQEIFLPNLTSVDEFKEAARLMHRWGKRVTNEPYHIPSTDRVINKNRRIGTGITGCLQSPELFKSEVLDEVYQAIQKENKEYSKAMGIPESIRTTAVKPSGTLSLLGDTTAGIHPAYSRYYIRRVRFASNDALIPVLKECGHPIEPVKKFDGTLDLTTLVVDFYCKAPEGTPCADEEWDTWKQLEVLKKAQKHWSDNSCSVTVYYKKEELPKIKEWLTENLQEVKTISFLCHNDHEFEQAPYEAITKEEYEKLGAKITELDFGLISSGDLVEGVECEGACPLR